MWWIVHLKIEAKQMENSLSKISIFVCFKRLWITFFYQRKTPSFS